MDDGIRTRDHRNHKPGLYQLSYIHRYSPAQEFHTTPPQRRELLTRDSPPVNTFAARQTGLEPVTCGLEGRRSIQLSYWRFVPLRAGRESRAIPAVLSRCRSERATCLTRACHPSKWGCEERRLPANQSHYGSNRHPRLGRCRRRGAGTG